MLATGLTHASRLLNHKRLEQGVRVSKVLEPTL